MFNLSEATQKFLAQNKNKRIVFTNGCFDILHIGHLRYLQAARELGDVLLVGVNSDQSVKKLKGPARPINTAEIRCEFLRGLRWVDQVEIFGEETPFELIKAVRPQVLVKGGDWPVEKIVGHEFVQSYGGIVQSLPFVDGFSTTILLQKMGQLL